MIVATHMLIYSADAPATRAFFRDVVGLAYVSEEPRDPDWLIFRSGPSEFGIHPTHGPQGEQWEQTGAHQLCFVVDDIEASKAELEARGATFDGDIVDDSFGRRVMMQVPGATPVMVYEASHATAYDL